ncbi:Papain-like cysteine protease AvrRpt2 [Mycobacterium bohemicum DSM 44277]|nr:Papain-like cysteine protease AvrRpt2 [Mycobacterium bohemicum DSM 44277]
MLMSRVKIAAIAWAAAIAAGVVPGLAGPAWAMPGSMYGDPVAAAKYWHYQQYWDDCVIMSSADVVGEVTGVEPSEEDIIDMAQSTPSSQGPGPIYTRPADPTDPNSGEGAWFRDIPTLLARYNVGAVIMDGNIDALERQLGASHKVVVSVNGEILWHKPVEDRDRHGKPAHNHSVVVTGVDTANQVVHVNDSGSESGRDEQVRMALFMRAWDAGNELMAVTS